MHHMAIDELATGFRATAWAPDGVIEAIESTREDWFALGVQFHPEADSASALDFRILKNLSKASAVNALPCVWRPNELPGYSTPRLTTPDPTGGFGTVGAAWSRKQKVPVRSAAAKAPVFGRKPVDPKGFRPLRAIAPWPLCRRPTGLPLPVEPAGLGGQLSSQLESPIRRHNHRH